MWGVGGWGAQAPWAPPLDPPLNSHIQDMFTRMIILNLIMNSVILAHHINDCCVFIIEQAYASFMKGSVSIELQNWKEALELFRQAK